MINEPVASARRDSFLHPLSYSFFLSLSLVLSSSFSISSRAVALLVRRAHIILAS